jgi:hypothetical protein
MSYGYFKRLWTIKMNKYLKELYKGCLPGIRFADARVINEWHREKRLHYYKSYITFLFTKIKKC